MRSKDLKKLMAEYRAKGWKIQSTNKSHTKWLAPDQKSIVVASSTPSDWRAIHKHTALLKKIERAPL
jgi:hypothetical protein